MAKPHDEFGVDFGLSGLTGFFRRPTLLQDEAAAVGLVQVIADDYDGAYAQQLLEDTQRLVESPLPDDVLVTLWLAATEAYFNPVAHGLDGRTWLRRIMDECIARIRQDDPSYVPGPPEPVTDQGLRDAVLEEIRRAGPALTEAAMTSLYADPLPDVVPALERAVTEADADLGFRLFLRAMKAYFVPIGNTQFNRYRQLGQMFGYHKLVVAYGNLNIWDDMD